MCVAHYDLPASAESYGGPLGGGAWIAFRGHDGSGSRTWWVMRDGSGWKVGSWVVFSFYVLPGILGRGQ